MTRKRKKKQSKSSTGSGTRKGSPAGADKDLERKQKVGRFLEKIGYQNETEAHQRRKPLMVVSLAFKRFCYDFPVRVGRGTKRVDVAVFHGADCVACIEIQGGVWKPASAHVRAQGYTEDRDRAAQIQMWFHERGQFPVMLEFTTLHFQNMQRANTMIKHIRKALTLAKARGSE